MSSRTIHWRSHLIRTWTVASCVIATAILSMTVASSASGPIFGGGGGVGGGWACPDVWDPVCGVDGVTYSNECYASVAGVEVAHHGPCGGGPGGSVPIGGSGGGWVGNPGGGFECIMVWDPVCGVDGKTYSNECFAALAGVEVAHHGPCEGDHGWPGGPEPIGLGGGGFACIDLWDPVCGVDGNTYSNECYAALAGVEVAHHGPCGGGPGGPVIIGGWGGDFTFCLCPRNHYCYTPPGECDADPVCMPRPEACLDVWDPVCGCNNVTYSNACYAAMNGVSVQFHDACSSWHISAGSQRPLPDLTGDGTVDVQDVLRVIDSLGCRGCPEDVSGTGEVDVHDLLLVISALGMTTN